MCSDQLKVLLLLIRPVIRGEVATLTPYMTTKLRIYPSNILQNPPFCINLRLKIKKKIEDAPNLRVIRNKHFGTLNINSSSILQVV